MDGVVRTIKNVIFMKVKSSQYSLLRRYFQNLKEWKMCLAQGKRRSIFRASKISRSSHQRCSVRKVFLEISQNSQENSCARVSFSCVHERLFEVHDRVRKHVVRCTKKRVPKLLILEALHITINP